MTISWYSISISLQSGEIIFNGYFSVDDTANLVTAFYETVNGYTDFNNNIYVNNGYYGEDSLFVNNNFSYGGTNINYMNYYNNPVLPNYNSSYAFFTIWFDGNYVFSPLSIIGDTLNDIYVNTIINPITNPIKTKQTIDPNIIIHSLKVGSTYKLNPISSSGQNYFLYKSSDDKIATIDRSGLIKAISPGKFNIQIYQPGTNLIEPCNYFLPWFITVY